MVSKDWPTNMVAIKIHEKIKEKIVVELEE